MVCIITDQSTTGTRWKVVAANASLLCIVSMWGSLIPVTGQAATAATVAKVGGKCTKLTAKSGDLVCLKKAGKLVWSRSVTTTTSKAAPTTTSKAAPTTTSKAAVAPLAPSSGSSAAPPTVVAGAGGAAAVAATPAPAETGIEGTWKATARSAVGYRVKEVLIGQSTEGVGRTNAVTGTLLIAGTKVTDVELTADMAKLKSDSDRRDGQVHTRILETAKFPTARLKLTAPIDFGTVPADGKELTAKASSSLTVRGVTKQITFDVLARRKDESIQVSGVIPFLLADFGIPDPSVADLVTTEQKGLLEFLVVFER